MDTFFFFLCLRRFYQQEQITDFLYFCYESGLWLNRLAMGIPSTGYKPIASGHRRIWR